MPNITTNHAITYTKSFVCSYGLKNKNWGFGFFGDLLPAQRIFGGFDYCPYREISVYIFFFALSIIYA